MIDRARMHHAGLDNIRWIVGDGFGLAAIPDASVDACVSHVVFQHIPDPEITLGYVRDMGRVLRSGGWSAFQVSNDPSIHRTGPRSRGRLAALLGRRERRPRGQDDPAWIGSAVDIGELRRAAADSGLEIERVVGEGTQFCAVLARSA
jgi:SAM-dependent methyltransferase